VARVELPRRGLFLEVESHGSDDAPAVILVMGLGLQLVSWPASLIDALLQAGRRVIVFDNRDVGLSGSGPLDPQRTAPNRAMVRYLMRAPFVPAYTIDDMAADTLALADALGLERFDLVGVSLGGMIGQSLAAQAPGRVRSLTSIMSSAGPRASPWPTPRVLVKFLRRPPPDADAPRKLAHFLDLMIALGHLTDRDEIDALRARLQRTLARAYNPAGTMRQLLAVLAAPDRSDAIRRIRAPTLIVHGEDDPLVPVAAAAHLATLLPKARVEIIRGLGHYLPNAKMPLLADLILAHLAEHRD
jgi:pimeloyl-ACP methyl ester carboxylesterase